MAAGADQRVLASDNARLTGVLRRVRNRLDEALTRADRASTANAEAPAQISESERNAQLQGAVAELRRSIAEARALAEVDLTTPDRGPDSGSEEEEKGRMSPPIGEVVDEFRRRPDSRSRRGRR